MTQYHLSISSPSGTIYDGDVTELLVRGIEGELAVLAGHVPFLTVLKPGKCRVCFADGSVRTARCEGGILSVGESVQLLSSGFSWEDSPAA